MSKEKTIIYEALYCCCIHESSYGTLSTHRSREGAEKAMNKHRDAEKKEWDEMYRDVEEPSLFEDMKFGQHEDWDVREIELLD